MSAAEQGVPGDVGRAAAPRKPHLIYMNAYGDKYQRMALALIDTLRSRGNFKDDITVFCDSAEWARNADATPVVIDKSCFGNVHPTVYRFLLDA